MTIEYASGHAAWRRHMHIDPNIGPFGPEDLECLSHSHVRRCHQIVSNTNVELAAQLSGGGVHLGAKIAYGCEQLE
ncbi:hypothetical protein [Pseudomonas protegens]|uniref:hypothetical protein n=1 Tax=Pseudomonas protegens TaxID=380021 RepID=UPI0028BECDA5|nr:hypothetical protein [Pseudomonas protegens]